MAKLLDHALKEPAIIIDFDGVVCENKYPDFGKPKPGVREALEKIKAKGYKIIIHTVRTASYWQRDQFEQYILLNKYLEHNKIPFDYIFQGDKPVGAYYIDDRAIRFEDNWAEIADIIEENPKI